MLLLTVNNKIKYNISKGDVKMKKLVAILIINLMHGCGFISQISYDN